MKKLLFIIFLLCCLIVSFVPFISAYNYEDYIETLTPVLEVDFDTNTWVGVSSHIGASLVSDGSGGYCANLTSASESLYVVPDVVLPANWSVSFDVKVISPATNVGNWIALLQSQDGEVFYSGVALQANANIGLNYNSSGYTDISGDWAHITWSWGLRADGVLLRSMFVDGDLYQSASNVGYGGVSCESVLLGAPFNSESGSYQILIDNIKVYDNAWVFEGVVPTPTPSPSPVPTDRVDTQFTSVPSYYMIILVLFAVVAVLAGIYVGFERDGGNKGVAFLFALVALVIFVVLIVGYLAG